MAQLRDTVVSGSLRATDSLLTTTLQTKILNAPTESNGPSYGPGSNGQILFSNSTSIYWGSTTGITSVGTITTGTWSATKINPNKGGTGIDSYTKGDILYAGANIANTATTALSKLAIGTAGYTLQATANGPAWTQTVAVANGGTGKTSWTQWGIVYASASTTLAQVTAGASENNGYLLESKGAAAPDWIQATNSNTASTIVKRDASGNFSAGTITAALSGNATTATTASYLSAPNDSGYTTDGAGNFTHKRTTTSDYWHLNKSDGTATISMYWESGNITSSGTITAAGFSGNATSSTSAKWLMNRGGDTVTIDDSSWSIQKTPSGHTNRATVFKQKWTQSGLTYTPSGGSATTNTNSADLALWLSSSNTDNVLQLNMQLDGLIYAMGGFIGNVTGDCSGSANYIACPDTRSTALAPQDLSSSKGVRFDFKGKSISGLTANFSGIMSFRPYASASDWSGGPAHQLAFDENGIHRRRSTDSTTWGTWYTLLDSNNYTSYLGSGGTASYLNAPNEAGMSTDVYGNPKHKRATNTDTYSILSNNGTNVFNVNYETGVVNCTNGIQFPTAGANNKSKNWISAGGGYSNGSGKYGVKIICCEQNDCLSGLGQDCGGGPYELSIITGQNPSNATQANIRFLRHNVASPTAYTQLASITGDGAFYSTYGRFSSTTDAAPGAVNAVALITGNYSSEHLEFDSNEILAKTNASTLGILYFQDKCYVNSSGKLYNAVWNDFAEYRSSNVSEPGRVVVSDGNGQVVLSTKRLQSCGHVISDTYGIAVGESEQAKTPLGVAGRVLVIPYRERGQYKVGDCLCAAPNGTADIMTREEIKEYPDRIIGIVDEIPEYKTWTQIFNVKNREIKTSIEINGRIWIYVK